jgi:hypothetical protein
MNTMQSNKIKEPLTNPSCRRMLASMPPILMGSGMRRNDENRIDQGFLKGIALPVTLSIVMIAALVGCERAEQTTDSAVTQAPVAQPAAQEQPLGHVIEFDGFTLRANVSRTDFLSDDMARQYGIDAAPDRHLLNLVILENRPDRQPEAVSAEVSAQYESMIGQVEAIDMRVVEADGHVSYIGTLDASDQRIFKLVIEARPAGTDQLLRTNFEVRLESFEAGDKQ